MAFLATLSSTAHTVAGDFGTWQSLRSSCSYLLCCLAPRYTIQVEDDRQLAVKPSNLVYNHQSIIYSDVTDIGAGYTIDAPVKVPTLHLPC